MRFPKPAGYLPLDSLTLSRKLQHFVDTNNLQPQQPVTNQSQSQPSRYPNPEDIPSQRSTISESGIEDGFIQRLDSLKYTYRPDIRDREALEKNFRGKFEELNQVRLTDAEFARLLDEIISPDVFTASKTLRSINAFTRDDGTPLNYTLVNIKDWCKNNFEVIHQLRINTDNSHHRYDVILLINGVPVVQIELKTLGVNPRRAMEQIVDYKNDPGNGYARTLLCFMQMFIVSTPRTGKGVTPENASSRLRPTLEVIKKEGGYAILNVDSKSAKAYRVLRSDLIRLGLPFGWSHRESSTEGFGPNGTKPPPL